MWHVQILFCLGIKKTLTWLRKIILDPQKVGKLNLRGNGVGQNCWRLSVQEFEEVTFSVKQLNEMHWWFNIQMNWRVVKRMCKNERVSDRNFQMWFPNVLEGAAVAGLGVHGNKVSQPRRINSAFGENIRLGSKLQNSPISLGGESDRFNNCLCFPRLIHGTLSPIDWTTITSLLSKPSRVIRYRETMLWEKGENENETWG